MRRVARALLPQSLRLRLWLATKYFTPASVRVRRAQPTRRQRLVARTELRRRARSGASAGIERMSAVMLINLRSRPDRFSASMGEMNRLGIERVERFEAIAHANGTLGCALSHLACLEQMIDAEWESMLVCEDDLEFLVSRPWLDVTLDAFLDDTEAAVACLAGRIWRSTPYSNLFLRGTCVQQTACYAVKRTFVETLADVWERGVDDLLTGATPAEAACDRTWLPLQETATFLVPIVRSARQRRGFSDVLARHVDYAH